MQKVMKIERAVAPKNRGAVRQKIQQKYPGAEVRFRAVDATGKKTRVESSVAYKVYAKRGNMRPSWEKLRQVIGM